MLTCEVVPTLRRATKSNAARAASFDHESMVRRLNAVETYHKYGRMVSVGGLELELVDP